MSEPHYITIYANKQWYSTEYLKFLDICDKRKISGSDTVRKMIEKYNKVNGKGQITLDKANGFNHKSKKQDLSKCRFCGNKRLKAFFLKGGETIPVCLHHFYEFKTKYEAWRDV